MSKIIYVVVVAWCRYPYTYEYIYMYRGHEMYLCIFRNSKYYHQVKSSPTHASSQMFVTTCAQKREIFKSGRRFLSRKKEDIQKESSKVIGL